MEPALLGAGRAAGAADCPRSLPACAVTLPRARYHAPIESPATIRLPPIAGACVSIVVDRLMAALQPGPQLLRVYLAGAPAFCARLRDSLFTQTVCAYVERPDGGQWSLLDRIPLKAVGFAGAGESGRALPPPCDFFDLDLAALATYLAPGGGRLTLHLALSGPHGDAGAELASLSSAHLVPGCAPAAGLFPDDATPAWRPAPYRWLNRRAPTPDGLQLFMAMLSLYDLAQSAAARRQLAGIVSLAPCVAGVARPVSGIDLRMTLDDAAFIDGGIALFAGVIDHFLRLYLDLDQHVRLILVSAQSGAELWRGPSIT